MWDLLRPILDLAEQVEFGTKLFVLLFSLAFAAIAAMAYLKKRTKRLLYIAAAFGLFAVQALVQVIDLFVSPGYFFNPAGLAFSQLLVMALLFIAIFKHD